MPDIPPDVLEKMKNLRNAVEKDRTDAVLKTQAEGAKKGADQPKMDPNFGKSVEQKAPAPTGPNKE